MNELAVGREFADFESLSTYVKHFEHKYLTQFYKRDNRKIEADGIRNTRKTYNVSIKYANITYA